jgi:plastocyanin
MAPRSLATRALLAAPLFALAACGGSGETVETTIPATADLVVKAVPTIRWDAASYTAPAGDVEIFLANDDNVKHTLVILQDDKVVGDLELEVNQKGDTDSGTITLEPGQYYIYCTVPGHASMKSTLTVS